MAKQAINKKDSFYASALSPKRGRKFGAFALDYFVLSIMSVLVFLLVNLIVDALPSVKAKQTEIGGIQQEMTSLVEESKLGEVENGTFLDNKVISKRYVYGITYRSLIENGVEESNITSSITSVYKPMTKENDNAYFYYTVFKPNHLSNYSEEDKGLFGVQDYQNAFSSDTGINFLNVDDYLLLNKDNALKVQNYILDSAFTPGKAIFTTLENRYSSLLEDAIAEFQTKYTPYTQKAQENEARKSDLYGIRRMEIAIAYSFAILLHYLLLPLLLKDGRTITMRALSLAYCSTDKKAPAFWQLLVHASLLFVEESSVMAILPFFVYGANAIDLVYLPFLWGISLLWVFIFSLLFMILSFVSSFFDKESKSTTTEFLSHLLLKDGKEFQTVEQQKAEHK